MAATPDGPLMTQFGAREMLVWRWDGDTWTPESRVLSSAEAEARPVAYYDEEAGRPVVGYVERSGSVTLLPMDGSEPFVAYDSENYDAIQGVVFDPSIGKPLLYGTNASLVLDGERVARRVAGLREHLLFEVAADPAGSRVLGLDFDRVTYAWEGNGFHRLAPPPALRVPIITSMEVMRHVGTHGGRRRVGRVGGCQAVRVGLVR